MEPFKMQKPKKGVLKPKKDKKQPKPDTMKTGRVPPDTEKGMAAGR